MYQKIVDISQNKGNKPIKLVSESLQGLLVQIMDGHQAERSFERALKNIECLAAPKRIKKKIRYIFIDAYTDYVHMKSTLDRIIQYMENVCKRDEDLAYNIRVVEDLIMELPDGSKPKKEFSGLIKQVKKHFMEQGL